MHILFRLLLIATVLLPISAGAVKVPDMPELTPTATGDLLYAIDISDTTDNAAGSSKKVTVTTLLSGDATLSFNDGSDFSGSIEDVAQMGVTTLTHAPTGDSNAIFTPRICKAEVDLSNGDMRTEGALNTSHAISCYAYMLLLGDGDWSQQFVNESKFKSTNSGTGNTLVFYKASIDAISGTVTNFIGLDYSIDLDAASVTYTNSYALYAPQNEHDILIGGDIVIGQAIDFDATITATVGAVTINKSAGRVILALGAQSVVVTNSLVTADSIILLTMVTPDATSFFMYASAGSGSFTILANATATANMSINFLVVN